jgi:3-phenylpropionate/cinnamic acid dioxygenase small subunit
MRTLITPVDADVRHAVDELYADYVEALDEGPIDAWPELFTEDGEYLLIAKENHDRGLPVGLMRCESRGMLTDRVRSITQLSLHAPRVLRHVLGPLRVHPAPVTGGNGPSWTVTASYVVFQTLLDADTQVLSCGRYLDLVVADGDRLRLRRKVTVYDNPLVPNSIVFPL